MKKLLLTAMFALPITANAAWTATVLGCGNWNPLLGYMTDPHEYKLVVRMSELDETGIQDVVADFPTSLKIDFLQGIAASDVIRVRKKVNGGDLKFELDRLTGLGTFSAPGEEDVPVKCERLVRVL